MCKKPFLLMLFLLFLAAGQLFGTVLNVAQNMQIQTQWCWAATSQSMLQYYGYNFSQNQIAEYGTEGTNIWNWLFGESSDPTRRGIDMIMMHFAGQPTTSYERALTFVESESNLNAYKPFFVRWGWNEGGGHFVVFHGITDSTVYLMDPWYGATMNSYNWVLQGSTHTWTHSLEMIQSPISASSCLPFPANMADNIPRDTNLGWVNADSVSTIQVLFGIDNPPTQIIYQGSPVSMLTSSQLGGTLGIFTNYFWRVNTIADTILSLGPVWMFVTSNTTAVDEETQTTAHNVQLTNYPNPFNPVTTISYILHKAEAVKLDIFNLRGERVRQISSGMQTAGSHVVIWDGKDEDTNCVASGIYVARLQQGAVSTTIKMLLLK